MPDLIVTPYTPSSTKTYSQLVLESSPTVYYKMNNPSPSASIGLIDDSGNQRTATYGNNPPTSTVGLLVNDSDTAMIFGGVQSRYATLLYPANASWINHGNTLTLEVLLKPTLINSGSYHAIFSRSGGIEVTTPARMFDIYIEPTGKFRAQFFNSANASCVVTSSTTASVNSIYHIAATYDGASAILYINGIAEATAPGVGGTMATGSRAIMIGQDNIIQKVFRGTIDEVSLYYGVALSPSVILSHSQKARL